MICNECNADAVIVKDCEQCGPLGASAKCDHCGAFAENPDHAAHAFAVGDKVRIDAIPGQVDHGRVVTATHDLDGHRITVGQVAVEVENGQGIWGYSPSELTRV